jgi:hypothetical protein
MFYSPSNMITDAGIIFQEFSSEFFLEETSGILDFTNVPTNNYVYDNLFYGGKKSNVYNRSYIKVQAIAAVVGGFLQLARIILKICYTFYFEGSFKKYFYEELFTLIEDDGSSLQNKKKVATDVNSTLFNRTTKQLDAPAESTNELYSRVVKPTILNNVNSNLMSYYEKAFIKNKKVKKLDSNLEITKTDIFKFKFLFKRNEKKFVNINMMEESINSKLEILNYFSLFRNVNLIKKMLLNKFQLNLLSKCNKDILNINETSNDSQENIDIVNYLRPLLTNTENKELDKKDLILWEAMDIEEKDIIFSKLNNKELHNETSINNFVR